MRKAAPTLGLKPRAAICKPRFSRQLVRSCNAITAVSRYTANWVEKEFGLPTGSVPVIYNGVDCVRFTPAASPPEGLPVINFVGRTRPHKAPDLMLSAALLLAEQTTDFAVQMIGSNFWHKHEMDDYQRKIQSLIELLERRLDACAAAGGGAGRRADGARRRWRR